MFNSLSLCIIGLFAYFNLIGSPEFQNKQNIKPLTTESKTIESDFVYHNVIFGDGFELHLVSTDLDLYCVFFDQSNEKPTFFYSGVQIDFFFPDDISVFKKNNGEYFILFPLYPDDNERGIIHKLNVMESSTITFCKTIDLDSYFEFTSNFEGERGRELILDELNDTPNYLVYNNCGSIIINNDCNLASKKEESLQQKKLILKNVTPLNH